MTMRADIRVSLRIGSKYCEMNMTTQQGDTSARSGRCTKKKRLITFAVFILYYTSV